MSKSIDEIRASLNVARAELERIDRDNPEHEVSAADARANPYRRPAGDNGRLELDELDQARSPLAKKLAQAALYDQGSIASCGGGEQGFRTCVMPAGRPELAGIGALARDVVMIARALDRLGNGNRHVDGGELDRAAVRAAVIEHFTARPSSNRSSDTRVPADPARRMDPSDGFVERVVDLVIASASR